MTEACSVARGAQALANRRVGDDPMPGRAAVFADLAPAVIVSVGAYVKDSAIFHDFAQQGLDAFGHPYSPRDSVFRCLAGNEDTREGSLVEMDPRAGHGPKLFAVPHAGIGQHSRNQAGMGRAVGE